MSQFVFPDNEWGGGGLLYVCMSQAKQGVCVAAVNEMGGYQGRQASLSPA